MIDQNIKILFITASPDNEIPIGYESEYKVLKEAIKNSPNADKIKLEFIPAVNHQEIFNAFMDYQPNIIHFAAHGSGTGNLLIEDSEHEKGILYEKGKMDLLLRNMSINVECIVLSSCFSDNAIRVIHDQVEYIVSSPGYQYELEAVIFAREFYKHVCNFSSFFEAYRMAILSLGTNSIAPRGLPSLSGKKVPIPFKPKIESLKETCSDLKTLEEEHRLKLEKNWADQILYRDQIFGDSKFSDILRWLSDCKEIHKTNMVKHFVPDRKPNDRQTFQNDMDIIMCYLETALLEESNSCLEEPDFTCSLGDKYPYEEALKYLCKRLPESICEPARKEFKKMTTLLLGRLHYEKV